MLVTLTTSWPRLLTGLRGLHVPRLFVTVAAMAHRYIFHLLDIVSDVYVARRARTVKPDSAVGVRRFVGASAGVLFGKATHLTGEVHQAMVARGYVGEAHALDAPAFTRRRRSGRRRGRGPRRGAARPRSCRRRLTSGPRPGSRSSASATRISVATPRSTTSASRSGPASGSR